MISELRRRKFTALFPRVDVNGNGVVDREDFMVVGEKYIEQGGWSPDSEQVARLHAIFGGWWEAVAAGADADKDGVVTLEEFVTGAAAVDRDALELGGPMLFDAFDRSGDGLISPTEYRALLSIYGVDAADADEIFPRLDLDGDGHVTREEFASLFVTFCLGEDEDAPGNWLLGPF